MHGEEERFIQSLVGNLRDRDQLEDNIKMDLQEVGVCGMT